MSKTVILQLKKLRKAATFENASFGHGDDGIDQICKEKTRLYRETWVLPLIDELIEYHEGKIKAEQLTAKRYPF